MYLKRIGLKKGADLCPVLNRKGTYLKDYSLYIKKGDLFLGATWT